MLATSPPCSTKKGRRALSLDLSFASFSLLSVPLALSLSCPMPWPSQEGARSCHRLSSTSPQTPSNHSSMLLPPHRASCRCAPAKLSPRAARVGCATNRRPPRPSSHWLPLAKFRARRSYSWPLPGPDAPPYRHDRQSSAPNIFGSIPCLLCREIGEEGVE
jgi:hypothetical protein